MPEILHRISTEYGIRLIAAEAYSLYEMFCSLDLAQENLRDV
jgi:CTP:phosphocholine cytidylyltransferase-like protein